MTAKRLGWDEQLTAEQEFDLEPYADKGYASDDLRGVFEVSDVPASGSIPAMTDYLVGGHSADPKTIRPAKAE